jgi:hypothetical protein
VFVHFFQSRTLRWALDQGSAIVTMNASQGSFDAQVSTLQMVILHHLGDGKPHSVSDLLAYVHFKNIFQIFSFSKTWF